MSLPADLLEQAEHLLTRERNRPRQASLRRAISTAYYALFHLLVEEASRLILAGTTLDGLRPKLARAFTHAEMKQVARTFTLSHQAPKLPTEIDAIVLVSPGAAADVAAVARAFVRLQESRHAADDNTDRRFNRREVELLVDLAQQSFLAWRRTRTTPLARAFLISLLVGKRWDRE